MGSLLPARPQHPGTRPWLALQKLLPRVPRGQRGPSLRRSLPGPGCSPSPFLKMMPTLPSLPASSLLYMTHSGFILESMKVHCSTLPGTGQSAGAPPQASGGARGGPSWGSPDFGQQGAGVEWGLQVGEGLQVGLLAHAQVHELLGLGLGALLGAHFDKVVQGLQLAQCFPLARTTEGQCGQAKRGWLWASGRPR